MKITDFSPDERIEIETAVVDAYTGDEGQALTHAEAAERFDGFLADAVQAQRPWAPRLLDAFRRDGAERFAKSVWKNSTFFQFRHRERARTRALNRGRQRLDESTGRREWVQESLLGWDADALTAAIADAVRQIEEHRANIAMYRYLLDLLEQTEKPTVRLALEAVGMSLEEYLDERSSA